MPATKPTPAVARSLANATVVLTRPAGTARALARQARQRGATVLLLPGLGLSMRREPAVLEALRAA
ncbi:MAG: uroporphyrinogen-III synthase, partial [Xanthomonadales bacterium]|nr:uroporphyrinogen-III synthase [Xanthomonadales bacterium]